MADPRADQKLAAILAADVAGYSRLMEAGERATMATLDAYRAVFQAGVAGHGGRIVGRDQADTMSRHRAKG